MGSVLLVTAAVAAMVAAGSAFAGMAAKARAALIVVSAALIAATVRLVVAIWRLDFSFVYVANQSRARSSGGYRLAALWGGAEGSLLFFAALCGAVLLWVLWRRAATRFGLVIAALVLGWLAFTVVAFANPFSIAELPAVRGAGLTPILEHPAMLYHPPILYLGLVATFVAFLLVLDRPHGLGSADLAMVRRSLLVAWTLLTIGLATGANWAYVELGWGGYWAWDPVENTVLMPWLVITAAIHVLRDQVLSTRFPRTTVALLLAPFPLVAFGAAVTRSGGLSSVHAFADAEALGWTLGVLVAALVAVTIWRISLVRSGVPERRPPSLRHWLLIGSGAIATFMTVVVMMGVAYPLLPGVDRIVTAQFYNRVGVPVLVVALLIMTAAPTGSQRPTTRRIGLYLGGVAAAASVGLAVGIRDALALGVTSVAVMVILGHLFALRRTRWAAVVGHIGFAVLAVGVAGSAQADTVAAVLAPGESMTFGDDLRFRYESFLVSDGPRARSEAVTVQTTVSHSNGDDLIRLSPGLVSYPDRAVVLAETSLHSTPTRDIQVVLRTISDEGLASFELSERPVQMLVWWGSVLIAVAGVVAIATKRSAAV